MYHPYAALGVAAGFAFFGTPCTTDIQGETVSFKGFFENGIAETTQDGLIIRKPDGATLTVERSVGIRLIRGSIICIASIDDWQVRDAQPQADDGRFYQVAMVKL